MTDAPGPYREESLRQALATDPRVMEQELDVSIAGDRVVISGTVPTEDRRAAVTEVARERFPDLQVDNRTIVPTLPASGGEERVT
ncbi:MAG: BON domain-containing protein [Actinobacteria bacterium]|nr:MAG: BON domain-containing protein [Actinomycetota bacterium]TMK86886.1 MAG: BON domain-containing protein [Actinomycetota bacterium]